jgi:probable HAF family extracellular repeat protein
MPYTFKYLNDPAATDGTVPEGINDSGQVVGHYTGADNNFHGFLYNLSSSTYATLTDPSGTSTFANGINNSGRIVGFSGDFSASGGSSATHAFTYDSSNFSSGTTPRYVSFDDPSALGSTVANGINDSGLIVGAYRYAQFDTHGFLVDVRGNYTDLAPGAISSEATGINRAGWVVGDYRLDRRLHQHGFLYTAGTYVTLDDPLGTDTYVTGINNVGQIVGYYIDSSGTSHGFIYNAGAYTTVDDAAVTSSGSRTGTFLNGINAQGEIVGYSWNGGSSDHQGLTVTLPKLIAFTASSVEYYVPGTTPVVLDSGLTLDSQLGNTVSGATVAITGGTFGGDDDVLAFNTAGTHITAHYDSASETLTLAGSDTLANYQSVLRSVTFSSSSQDPMQSGAHRSRTVSWVVSSASAASAPVTMIIDLRRLPGLTVNSLALSGNGVRGEQLTLGNLLQIMDRDNVGFQKLELADSNGTVTGGQFVVNGVAQSGGHEIDVAPADLSKTVYDVGTLGGTDTLWARLQQINGVLTPWQQFTVTAPPDTAPTVAVANMTATHLQNLPAANLFSAADADGDALTQYAFYNTGTGGGHFMVDGVALPVAQEIDEPAAYLSHVSYQSGSGADTLYVRAYDGALWGNWSQAFTVTAPPDAAPTVSVANLPATHGQSFAAGSLFSASDPDGDPVVEYQFWNAGTGGGRFVLDGLAMNAMQGIDVSAARLSHLTYQSGSGADTLYVRASDGALWSNWSNAFTVTAPIDTGPVVTPINASTHAVANQTFAASSLMSYSDPFNSPAVQYDFYNNGGGGGHFLLNGTALPANHENIISASQLSQLSYQVGTGTDTLWARANDGTVWGAWSSSFTMSDPPPAIGAGETLTFGSAFADTVSFLSDTGTLKLDDPSSFAGTVAGLHGQDAIDFADIGFGANSTLGYSANADNSGGTLSVGDGMHTVNIALLGSYMASTFAAASDGHGGTLISEAAQASTQTPIVAQPHA